MRFVRLRIAVAATLAVFFLIVGNIIAIGLLQKIPSPDLSKNIPGEIVASVGDNKSVSVKTEPAAVVNTSPPPKKEPTVKPAPPPPEPVVITHVRRTRAS